MAHKEQKNNYNEKPDINVKSEEQKFNDKEQAQKTDDTSKEITETENLQNKVKELNDKFLRTLAELENTRRRTAEELEKTSKYAISKFAMDLIPVLENFYLAMSNAPKEKLEENEILKNFHKGVEITQKEMEKVLEKHGVKRIYPIGKEFNHDLHQAISKVASEEKEGTVIDVLQAGYTINDRILRPALVVVAMKKE